MLAAQSIGEPATQMTLNTFHYAGVRYSCKFVAFIFSAIAIFVVLNFIPFYEQRQECDTRCTSVEGNNQRCKITKDAGIDNILAGRSERRQGSGRTGCFDA